MPLPEHVTPVGSRQGRAPYNFVPLPEAIFHPETEPFRQHDRLDPERLHGFIELTITTETELYTRCAYPPDQENQTVQQSRPRQAFYHLDDERRPVIPGSSLRGMTRALVEILAYSRLTRRSKPGDAQRILDEKLVHRAVADQNTPTGQAYNERFLKRIKNMQFDYPNDRVQAGYLEAGHTASEWRIRPARKLNGVSFVRVKLDTLSRHGFSTTKENDVEDVWVKPEPKKPYPHHGGLILHYARTENLAARTASPAAAPAGMEPGKLIYSGRMGSRHMHTVIYEKDTKATPIPIPETMWEQFCEDRDQQRGIPCRRILQPGDPLFYLLDPSGKLEFIGPTLFFRLPYKNYTGDYAPQFTVDADGPLDLAEAIFGTVNGEPQDDKPQTGSHKSRLRFDDAEWVGSGSPFLEGEDGIRWPAVLSKPKPTSYQNYLVQSDPEGRKEKLLSYSAPPPDSGGSTTTALRGFKLYWHRESADKDLHLAPLTKHVKQYTVIRPVKSGMEFRGRVRFENLNQLELGALLAALELPANYRHHLGMGKPLGMGSVRVEAATTLYDPVKRYQSLAVDGRLEQADQNGKLAEAREAFRKAIVQHLNTKVPASTVPDNTGLWEIPRLRTLGMLLDWENQPKREKTAYIPAFELKKFRDRQVLPTPAGVLGQPEPLPPAPAANSPTPILKTRPVAEQDWDASTPALQTLQAILQDSGRGQREQLEAIDDALLHQLAGLDEPRRQRAWTLIRGAIGVNRRTRERLQTIQQRLAGG
ncbi:MAG: TIGR03986 family CRISPR-associated RAMP protein [Candidatus Contendobacter sp.]|nr:TIGR03986 family CRISPR-associated RAMP protein [Candidatus Contendobacter sp.]